MRVAAASNHIQDWLEELSTWPWPTHDTSAGFERPPAKRRKLFERSPSDNGLDAEEGEDANRTAFLGSLQASEVARYERRIHEIGKDMAGLDVEEIKDQILHNHIAPLSRPGTPMSDSLRASTMSASAYAHMDDFTALITATIVQALPNLSKLTRLLNAWSIRLVVLRKSSSFLTALMDAEIALKAGWRAMEPQRDSGGEVANEDVPNISFLSRSEFDVMKLVVERKVGRAGQYLDLMLDALEGLEDTLPEDWVDRMDTVEHNYAEWAASCDRLIRAAEWVRLVQHTRPTRASPSGVIIAERSNSTSEPPEEASSAAEERGEDAVTESATSVGQTQRSNGTPNSTLSADGTTLAGRRSRAPNPDGEAEDGTSARSINGMLTSPPAIMVHPAAEDHAGAGQTEQQAAPGPHREVPAMQGPDEASEPRPDRLPDDSEDTVSQIDKLDDTESAVGLDISQPLSDGDAPTTAPVAAGHRAAPKFHPRSGSPGETTNSDMSDAVVKRSPPQLVDPPDSLEDDDDFPDSELPEPQLPSLPHERRGSEASSASTIIHGLQSESAGFSSDPPDHGTPAHQRLRDVVLPSTESDGVDLSDDADLPSSPPDFRSSTRSMSVSFNDIPTFVEAPEEDEGETPPGTPLDTSFGIHDDLSRGANRDSPGGMGVNSADDQLQQQISEILDSIPAKIRLASEPSGINLNPPDFRMPTTRPKAKPDSLPPRSYSSLSNRSSRAGTPSFTLAPAKNPRARHQRGNQEIKLYHLSRSNGEAPIKLFIRCVGDSGERVMVRVGGGWADLGEYLKEYASHHGRRGGEAKVEVRDLPRVSTASPPSRPASAMDVLSSSPITPLNVRKARRSVGSSAGDDLKMARQALPPKTPLTNAAAAEDNSNTPSSGGSSRSRPNSRLSWAEEDSSLGMAGPKSKHVEMSEENKAWVESVKAKVRLASGDQRAAAAAATATLGLAGKSPAATAAAGRAATPDAKLLPDSGKFGELGKVGSTKRLFRRQAGPGTGNGSGK